MTCRKRDTPYNVGMAVREVTPGMLPHMLWKRSSALERLILDCRGDYRRRQCCGCIDGFVDSGARWRGRAGGPLYLK